MLRSPPFISRCPRSIHFPAHRQEIKHFSYNISRLRLPSSQAQYPNQPTQIHLILSLLKTILPSYLYTRAFCKSRLSATAGSLFKLEPVKWVSRVGRCTAIWGHRCSPDAFKWPEAEATLTGALRLVQPSILVGCPLPRWGPKGALGFIML